MQEVFYEESATLENRKSALRKYNTLSIFQIISIVMIVLWAIIVVTAIPLQDMGKAVGIVLVILPFLTFGLLTFIIGRHKKGVFVDYDYTFVTGSIRISKVIRERKRKFLIKFESEEIEKLGEYASETYNKYEKMPGIKKKIFTSNVTPAENKKFYYLVVNTEGDKHLLVLECTELFLVNVLKFAKNKQLLVEEGFGRTKWYI